jgi:hypothetical protein
LVSLKSLIKKGVKYNKMPRLQDLGLVLLAAGIIAFGVGLQERILLILSAVFFAAGAIILLR